MKRTQITPDLQKLVGIRLRAALQEEHVRWQRKARNGLAFSTERFSKASEIPYRTIHAYLNGERFPSALDLREFARFTGHTMEHFLEPVPGNVQLLQAWKEEQEEIDRRRQEQLEREAHE